MVRPRRIALWIALLVGSGATFAAMALAPAHARLRLLVGNVTRGSLGERRFDDGWEPRHWAVRRVLAAGVPAIPLLRERAWSLEAEGDDDDAWACRELALVIACRAPAVPLDAASAACLVEATYSPDEQLSLAALGHLQARRDPRLPRLLRHRLFVDRVPRGCSLEHAAVHGAVFDLAERTDAPELAPIRARKASGCTTVEDSRAMIEALDAWLASHPGEPVDPGEERARRIAHWVAHGTRRPILVNPDTPYVPPGMRACAVELGRDALPGLTALGTATGDTLALDVLEDASVEALAPHVRAWLEALATRGRGELRTRSAALLARVTRAAPR